MDSVLLTWVALICGALTFVFLIAFLVTGRKNAVLRVLGGLSLLVSIGAGYFSGALL